MAYPDLPQTWESRKTPQQGLRTMIAEDGSVRAVNLHTATLYEFSVVHENLTSAQKNQIVSCYTANQTTTVSFQWKGDNSFYSVIFKIEPLILDEYGGRFRVTNTLLGHAV